MITIGGGVEGIITRFKSISNTKRYTLASLNNGKPTFHELETKALITLGDHISLDSNNEIIKKTSNDNLSKELAEIYETTISSYFIEREYPNTIKEIDLAISKFTPHLINAAKLLIKKLIMGSPIIMRFHNDADGSSSAYALYLGIISILDAFNIKYTPNILWLMQKTVVYELGDAIYDITHISSYSCVEKPLLFIADFGTSSQSVKAIKKASEHFDMIWLDHHPIEEGFDGSLITNYINPWNFGGDSNITAGLLCCIFAYLLSGKELKEIENASLIGDYSIYANTSKPGADLSAFLDMITSDPSITGAGSKNITPLELHELVNDKKRYDSLVNFAKAKMDETVDGAIKKIKLYKSKSFNIYVSDFSLFRNRESRYPLPGRFSSKLLDGLTLKNSIPCILLLHFGVYISIRIDKKIATKVNILGIIANLKLNYEDDVEAGGGHDSAASIKLSEVSDKTTIIKIIIKELKDKDL